MTKIKAALSKASKIVKLHDELKSVNETIENFKKTNGTRKHMISNLESDTRNTFSDVNRRMNDALDDAILEEMTQYMVTKLRKKQKKIVAELEKLSK